MTIFQLKPSNLILAISLLLLPVLILAANTTQAAEINKQAATFTYSWENGGTILGFDGNLVRPSNVLSGNSGSVLPHSGNAMLQVTEEPHSDTPQAFVALVEGLTDGDVVNASFYGWDDAPGSPRLRIWGHYSVSGDINRAQGTAGGNSVYTDGTGWSQVSHSWTFDSNGNTRDALVIEARLYSTPATDPNGSTEFWIDDIEITAPDTARVIFPTTNITYLLAPNGSMMMAGVNIENNTATPCEFTSAKYNIPPGGNPADPGEMPGQWNITTNSCTTIDANLTFYYSDNELAAGNNIDEANLNIFKNSSGAANDWVAQTGTLDVNNNTIELSGVTSFSSWTLADNISLGNSDPTAVSLQSFTGNSTNSILPITTLLVLLLGSTAFIWQRKCC